MFHQYHVNYMPENFLLLRNKSRKRTKKCKRMVTVIDIDVSYRHFE